MHVVRSELAVVFMPAGRDARVAVELLAQGGIEARSVDSIEQLGAAIERGAGIVVLTDEAIADVDMQPLARQLRRQPPWSDLPFIVLVRQGGSIERNPAAERLSMALANVSFLERPFHPTTLLSMARASLRDRRRQYQASDAIDEAVRAQVRYRVALEGGKLGTWSFDVASGVLTTSALCRSHYGRGEDEPLGFAEIDAAIHPDDRERMHDAVRRSLREGTDYDIAYRHFWRDGSLHWIEVRGSVRTGDDGRAVEIAGVTMDVTDRARTAAERDALLEALKTERAELEARVLDRTAALARANEELRQEAIAKQRAEEQLRQSQKLETMGQLVGGVAHDFNNLLAAIVSSLDVMSRRIGDVAGAGRLIATARRAADRGTQLTRRLLAFARKQDLHPEAIDLHELVAGMHELMQRSAGPRVVVRIEAGERAPVVLADRNQLELALLNLIVNARDALDRSGEVVVAIRSSAEAAVPPALAGAGSFAAIAVIDRGSGMTADTLRQAVEPFFSTKGVGQGTGLGLSMVHGMAVQSGGALVLESEIGAGTTATIWLPLAAGVGQGPHNEAAAAADAAVATAPAKTASILVVDDDELVGEATSALLEDLGYRVSVRHSGKAALLALSEGIDVDLVMTDMAMPGMTGLELADRLRTVAPALPILMVTGYDDRAIDLKGLPRLTKPYDPDALTAELERLLGPVLLQGGVVATDPTRTVPAP